MQDLIKDVLTGLLRHLNLPFTSIAVDDSDAAMIRVDIASGEASRLIGWHGETINAIQHLLRAMTRSRQTMETCSFIVLDVDGYRRAQEEKVKRITAQKADFVRRKKERIALPPMPPSLRRVVHLFIAHTPDFADIATGSIGEGDYRQVVLRLKEEHADDGDELVPVVSREEEKAEEEGFDNLDV